MSLTIRKNLFHCDACGLDSESDHVPKYWSEYAVLEISGKGFENESNKSHLCDKCNLEFTVQLAFVQKKERPAK